MCQFTCIQTKQIMNIRKQNHIPVRRFLPIAMTTPVIAALINSSVDLMLVGICLDNVAISCEK